MLQDIGINNVSMAKKADPNDLHARINQLNKEKKYFKGAIGLNDMKLFVEAAKELPQEIK